MTRGVLAVLSLSMALPTLADSQQDAAVALAKKTLSAKLGVSAGAVQLEKAEAVDWPDASLGCPEKGMMYAQMITPGHKVVLRAGGKSYPVHVGLGRAVVCGTADRPSRTQPAAEAAPAQQHHERAPDDPFRLQPLSGGVYCLYGRGGNVGFFVGSDAVVVVDSQFKDLGPGIVKQIQNVTDKPIRYLLNTHHHGDHVGGNDAFRPFSVIVAHDNVRKRMLEGPAAIVREYPARIEEAKKAGDGDAVKRLSDALEAARAVRIEEIPAPVVTFDSELRIHVGGETIHLWHTPPSHTDGDSVVFFEKANVVHMGDNLFHKNIPVIDVRGGGTPQGYFKALDLVSARLPANATVIPGHGEVTDVQGIRGLRQYISDLVELAKKAKAAGKSREAFVSECELPAYKDFAGYAQRFKSNCSAAFDELK
jgi:glyoxylase-like metal-dependent hydrolase (beta-lactamase superfamily II)